jgi:hypothetical protein
MFDQVIVIVSGDGPAQKTLVRHSSSYYVFFAKHFNNEDPIVLFHHGIRLEL